MGFEPTNFGPRDRPASDDTLPLSPKVLGADSWVLYMRRGTCTKTSDGV